MATSFRPACVRKIVNADADVRKALGQGSELLQSRLEVLDDLGGDDAGGGEVVGVFEALVAEPEDIQAGLVARHQLVVVEPLEPLGLLTLTEPTGPITGDEIIEVGPGQRVLLQGEVLIRA